MRCRIRRPKSSQKSRLLQRLANAAQAVAQSSGVDLLCAPDAGGGLCCKQQSSDPWQGVCNYIPSGNTSLTRAEIGMESKEETSAAVAGSTGL